MLIALSGLPGVGKTTLARALAARAGGLHLRIDTIGQALVRDGLPIADLGGRGYVVARALAGDLLAGGFTVVADAVGRIAATGTAWHNLARAAGVVCCDVEVVCGDRREVEARVADIAGHVLPTWRDVEAREFEPWLAAPRVVVDTAARRRRRGRAGRRRARARRIRTVVSAARNVRTRGAVDIAWSHHSRHPGERRSVSRIAAPRLLSRAWGHRNSARAVAAGRPRAGPESGAFAGGICLDCDGSPGSLTRNAT